jgi:subtilisin-like proprotein convertase family protein
MRRRILLCSLVALVGASSAGGATFPADPSSLGLIPDSPSDLCGTFGAARNVTFSASGLENHITNVEVTVQFDPLHGWAGDLDVVLIAPNAVKHSIFSRTGATDAPSCGDGSDLIGPYTFSDLAASPPHGGWWQAATLASAIEPIASGTYRTPAPGGAGAADPSPSKLMTPAFTSSNPNGVWTLRIRDGANGDTSSVSAASLTITAEHTDPPQTSFVKKPAKRTTRRRAVFRFKSSQTPATFECKLGTKAYRPCASPKTYTVGVGWHTLRVRAAAFGRKDATPAKYTWRVVRG